jgi:hypothetical protein
MCIILHIKEQVNPDAPSRAAWRRGLGCLTITGLGLSGTLFGGEQLVPATGAPLPNSGHGRARRMGDTHDTEPQRPSHANLRGFCQMYPGIRVPTNSGIGENPNDWCKHQLVITPIF